MPQQLAKSPNSDLLWEFKVLQVAVKPPGSSLFTKNANSGIFCKYCNKGR
jgi:hypothetical protein